MKSTVESPLPPGRGSLKGERYACGYGTCAKPGTRRAQAARNLVGLRAQRGGRGRLTVVRAVEADDHRPPGRAAHHLDRGLDRLGPVEGDVVAGEALRRHGQEPLAQFGGQLGDQ